MIKLRLTSCAIVLLMLLGANTVSASSLSDEDMSFVFGESTVNSNINEELVLLSSQEMIETEGEALPIFVLGLAARFTANQLFRHYAGSAGLAYGTYTFTSSLNRFISRP